MAIDFRLLTSAATAPFAHRIGPGLGMFGEGIRAWPSRGSKLLMIAFRALGRLNDIDLFSPLPRADSKAPLEHLIEEAGRLIAAFKRHMQHFGLCGCKQFPRADQTQFGLLVAKGHANHLVKGSAQVPGSATHLLSQGGEVHLDELRCNHLLQKLPQPQSGVLAPGWFGLLRGKVLAKSGNEKLEQFQAQRKLMSAQVLAELAETVAHRISRRKNPECEPLLAGGSLQEPLLAQCGQPSQSLELDSKEVNRPTAYLACSKTALCLLSKDETYPGRKFMVAPRPEPVASPRTHVDEDPSWRRMQPFRTRRQGDLLNREMLFIEASWFHIQTTKRDRLQIYVELVTKVKS